MTDTTNSLIQKLEAKIHGNYSEKEAYGRGLDQGIIVAIDIIRQHFASPETIYKAELARYFSDPNFHGWAAIPMDRKYLDTDPAKEQKLQEMSNAFKAVVGNI